MLFFLILFFINPVNANFLEIKKCLKISSEDDFVAINNNLSGVYCQTRDIDFSEKIKPIGSFSEPFAGVYDGMGFELKNIKIDSDIYEGAGIFGVSEGLIKNVLATNIEVKGLDLVGGLVGINRGKISNSKIFGNVVGFIGVGGVAGHNSGVIVDSNFAGFVSGYVFVGGISGQNFGGLDKYAEISKSTSQAEILGDTDLGGISGAVSKGIIDRSWSFGSLNGVNGIGGLVGHLSLESEIINSYSHSSVFGDSFIGGLVGGNSELSGFSKIINSYSTGYVSGSGEGVGGLVGSTIWGNLLVLNSYWDMETSSQLESAGGQGRTTAEMMKKMNYFGWDFRNIWGIEESYPFLKI